MLVATTSWKLQGGRQAVWTTAIVIAAMLAPLGLFIWNRYSSGHWETVDASAPKNRPALYTAALALFIPIGIYFAVRDRSAEMVRGLSSVAIVIGILAGLNRWIKLSVHMTLATFASVIIARVAPAFGVALLIFLPILAGWRLVLYHHRPVEVAGGFMLGLVMATLTLWL